MSFETIDLSWDERGVATLRLARPEKHNALNEAMMRELVEAAEIVEATPAVRAVILSAHGKSFCAGGDLNWMQAQAARDRHGKIEGARQLSTMLSRLDCLSKPLIARVQGNAFGGGVGMMAVADIVVAAENARFALTETRLGLIPATIGPYVIRRIGEGAARRTFLNGHRFGTDEALRFGLVSRSAAPDALDAAVEEEVALLLDCAPGAISEAKSLIRALARGEVEDPVAFSEKALADRWESEEAQLRIRRFLNP